METWYDREQGIGIRDYGAGIMDWIKETSQIDANLSFLLAASAFAGINIFLAESSISPRSPTARDRGHPPPADRIYSERERATAGVLI
jgi:hypothetical protein